MLRTKSQSPHQERLPTDEPPAMLWDCELAQDHVPWPGGWYSPMRAALLHSQPADS